MGKASEIWKEIKPKIGEMLAAVNDVETRAEKAQEEAYQKGLSDGKNQDAKDFADMYDSGYSEGLKVAWDAARKIILPSKRGGVTVNEFALTFGLDVSKYDVVEKYSASEAIERIKTYEQKKAKIGDEVVFYNGEKCLVTVVNDDGQAMEVMDKNGFSMKMDDQLRNNIKKTGRHFDEIATVLEKMRGE